MAQCSSIRPSHGSRCPALISLLHSQHPAQHHWWLADGGFPQRIAGLLAAPLQASHRTAHTLDELLQVFEPLPTLGAAEANPACDQASYRYLIRLRQRGAELCCWRRYPQGIGWQRRCGPMSLELFVRRFSRSDSISRSDSNSQSWGDRTQRERTSQA